jgi:hypothetical protein
VRAQACSSVLKLGEECFAWALGLGLGAACVRELHIIHIIHGTIHSDFIRRCCAAVEVPGWSGTMATCHSDCHPGYMHGVPSLTSCDALSAAVEQRQTTAHRQTRGRLLALCDRKINTRRQAVIGLRRTLSMLPSPVLVHHAWQQSASLYLHVHTRVWAGLTSSARPDQGSEAWCLRAQARDEAAHAHPPRFLSLGCSHEMQPVLVLHPRQFLPGAIHTSTS